MAWEVQCTLCPDLMKIFFKENGWGNVLIMVAKVVKIQDNLLIEC